MEGGRTVRVSGLPTDVEEQRLTDKLFIHFLRKRNGGGEISSVRVSEGGAGSALVTFEESEVAQRVAQRGKHILRVDDETYEVTVCLSHKKVDPDEVFVCSELTVDCSQLPSAKETLCGAQQSFPRVHFSFSPLEDLCTLKGRFSEIQALITQLLASLEPESSRTCDAPRTDATVSGPSFVSKKSLGRDAHSTGSSEWQLKARSSGRAPGLGVGNSGQGHLERNHRHSATDLALEDCGGWEVAAGTPFEDYSLALDSDIFRYLQQHRRDEYERILSRHPVEVVDVTAQDVTTLYLKAAEGLVGGARRPLEHMQQVHSELAQLYQEMEAQLRKEQLPKELVPRSGFKAALEVLQRRLPRLMISDDEMNVYLVGSGSDVSEAKQFFLDVKGTEGLTQGGVSHREPEAQQLRDTLFSTSTPVSLCRVPDDSENRLRKTEADRTHFREDNKETVGEDRLRSLLDDTQVRPSMSSVNSGLRLGTGLLFGPGAVGVGTARGQDIFKRTNSTESTALRSLMSTSTVLPSKNKHFASAQKNLHSDLLVDRTSLTTATSPPKLGSQSTLRRSNSFSGLVRPKHSDKEKEVPRNLPAKTKQDATHTFNASVSKRELYSVEMVVPTATWIYIKDGNSKWLEDLKPSVEIKEILSDNNITLQLSGPDAEKLSVCQQEVTKLVSGVFVKEFPLVKLGIKDPKDKTLEERCEDLRRRFPKVKIVSKSKTVHILGPKQSCDEVYLCLREDFQHKVEKEKRDEEGALSKDNYSMIALPKKSQIQQPFQEPSDFTKNLISTSQSYNSVDGCVVQHNSNITVESSKGAEEIERESKQKQGSKVKESAEKSDSTELCSGPRGEQSSQLVMRNDAGWKFPRGTAGSSDWESLKSDISLLKAHRPNWSTTSPSAPVSLLIFDYSTRKPVMPKESNSRAKSLHRHSSVDPKNQKTQVGEDSKQLDSSAYSRMPQESERQTCGCGVSGPSVSRTACGVTVCPKCLAQAHSSCSVCNQGHEPRGIKGNAFFSEMSFSLPGHPKDLTLKITYVIPSGIQGEHDPNPGASFQGGKFEAFLPFNERTRKLLPLLQKAFACGRTFVVSAGRVVWGSIPHKTSTDGGVSRNGYPDKGYLNKLEVVLSSLDCGEEKGTAQSAEKTQK
ncbi:uncharacterized protein LOC108919024 [Scleropages formosus]|uniref:RING-type E3 ubiquitin transferase n=1 Tax=Scleropages formosus TaxID=113540 RepID=A0A8C9RH60_SCLFO|nr:uncharacterized protein LOC108919024 [Scleropages formosus]